MSMDEILPKIGERVEKASRFVPKCNRLLDVGCGTGIISYFIKSKVKEIYGIDSYKEDLDRAKKRGLITKIVDFNTEKFPFREGSFNTVTCLDVIEHVLDPRVLLKEIYRVLKKDGVLIISTPNIRFTNHIYDLVIKGVFPKTSLDQSLYDGGHVHFFTYKDMLKLLVDAGFKNIQEEEIINKDHRGWKGRLLKFFLGSKLMREFRTPGILLVAKK